MICNKVEITYGNGGSVPQFCHSGNLHAACILAIVGWADCNSAVAGSMIAQVTSREDTELRNSHVLTLAAVLALSASQSTRVLADTPAAAPAKPAAADVTMPRITTADLKAKLDKHEKLTLVEALEQDHYAEWHLPGAIRMTMPRMFAPKLLPDKKAEIVVYCMNTH